MLNRRKLLKAAAAASALSATHSLLAAADRRPNFLFIMADDLGWADLGCYGRDDIRTPNLDRLAREGMKFGHAYSNSPICSPTRVGLITGRYQYRLPIGLDEPTGGVNLGLETDVPTMSSQLKAAGYQTSLIGKWHLGSVDRYSPTQHGYDAFWGLRGGGIDYYTHDVRRNTGGGAVTESFKDLWDGDTQVEAAGYLTDLIGDRAANEITRLQRNARPFLLSLHFTAPHWPWEAPNDAEGAKKVTNALHFDGGNIATYRAMVESLDANIGKALEALRKTGATRNTIVIFTSDNGGERFSKVWPFTGMKGECLEGGIRTPLIVRWPGRIKAGSETEQTAISMDWVPTFLEAAGVPAAQRAPTDGLSLLPALLEGRVTERDLFWRFKANEQAAYRRGPWKYLRINGTEYLFDVIADPQERGNLRSSNTERFNSMKAKWQDWNTTMLPYPATSPSWNNKALRTLPDRY